tara:strand:- start:24 stop:290 length:267 start_codon:yes stop_codon:yes gene_type:complete
MNTINEMMQQLNTMQSDHIKTLEQRIEVINEHKQHLNETITSQANQLQEQAKRIDKLIHNIEIDKITIRTQEDTMKIYINIANSVKKE